MQRTKTTLFVITLICFFETTHSDLAAKETFSIKKRCDEARCKNPAKLVLKTLNDQTVGIDEVEAEVEEYGKDIEIIVHRRKRWTAYCYQGSLLDPNTGCNENLREEMIPDEDARIYIEKGWCKTGHECGIDECVGTASSKCLSSELVHEIGPSKMGLLHVRNDNFAKHTCISAWECQIHKVKVATELKTVSGETSRVFSTKDNEIVKLGESFYEKGFKTVDNFRIIPLLPEKPSEPFRSFKTTIRCYSSKLAEIQCMIDYEGRGRRGFVLDKNTLMGVYRNYKIRVLGQIRIIEDGKMKSLVRRNEAVFSQDENIRAATIADLLESVNGLKMDQMQANYNAMQLYITAQKIDNILTKVIAFISKRNPSMLAEILGKDFHTKWLNDDVFLTCPCSERLKLPEYTNCFGSNIYIDGDVYITEKPIHNMCVSINENNITEVEVIEGPEAIDTEMLDFEPPRETSADGSIWDWLAKSRIRDINFSYNGTDPSIQGFLDQMGGMFTWRDTLLILSFSISLLLLMARVTGR